MKYRFVILLLLAFACQKRVYLCGLSVAEPINNTDSEILEYKRIGIADTTVANLSGNVYDLNYFEEDSSSLRYSNVWVRDVYTDSIIGTSTNDKGGYKLIIPASTYDIEVQFFGYNNLKIKNQKINEGEIIKFSTLLGQGVGETSYRLDSSYRPVKKNID